MIVGDRVIYTGQPYGPAGIIMALHDEQAVVQWNNGNHEAVTHTDVTALTVLT